MKAQFGTHSALTTNQLGMVLSEPGDHLIPDFDRKGAHFGGVGIGDGPDAFIPRNVSLLSEGIERCDSRRRCTDGLSERLNDAIVMLVAGRPVTGRSKGGGGCLEGGVVSDIHPPVSADLFGGAVRKVTLDDGEQVGDLLCACLVLEQPPVVLPVGQAHSRSR